MVFVGGVPGDSGTSSNESDEDGHKEIKDHDAVKDLLERAHFEHILSKVHDKL